MRNMSGLSVAAVCGSLGLALRTIGLPPRRWVLSFEIPEWFPNNVARNSLVACSNVEFASLELQRLWPISKNDRVKLRAKFVWGLSRWRVSARVSASRRVSTHAGASRRVSAPQLAAWTSGPLGAACASLWLDGRCMLPDLSPFYGTASASDNPGPLVPQWGYVPALNTVTAWSQFRTT